jgi:carnitine-CoA ligase
MAEEGSAVPMTVAEEYHDLASLLRGKAAKNGDKVALRFTGRDLSYAELDRETDRVANGLAAAGIAQGDRVAALLFNTPEFPLLWFGAAKRGAVLVPLNTGLKGEILRYELADSAPTAIVVDRRLWEPYAPLRAGLRIRHEFLVDPEATGAAPPPGVAPFSELPSDRPLDRAPSILPSDPVSIMYTSGTTGPPKGAIIPHQKQITTPLEIGRRSRLSPDSVLFTALPLFHCNAQEMTTLTALLNDVTAAFDERFHASTYWETAARATSRCSSRWSTSCTNSRRATPTDSIG